MKIKVVVFQIWRKTDNSDNDNDGTGETGENEVTETCQDEYASNFGLAGECEYSDPGSVGGEGEEYDLGGEEGNFTGDWGTGSGPGTGQPVIGCTDPSANNYNPNATESGYCSYGPTGTQWGDFDDTAQEISGPMLGSPGKLGDMFPTGGA